MNDTELLIGARLRLNKPHIFIRWSRGWLLRARWSLGGYCSWRLVRLAVFASGQRDRVNARDPR
jgi:hypothetical protein